MMDGRSSPDPNSGSGQPINAGAPEASAGQTNQQANTFFGWLQYINYFGLFSSTLNPDDLGQPSTQALQQAESRIAEENVNKQKGRIMTIYMCGTGSNALDATRYTKYWAGELVSSLYQITEGKNYIHKLIVDGVGSGDNDLPKLWVPSHLRYPNLLEKALGIGIPARIQHILAVIKNRPEVQETREIEEIRKQIGREPNITHINICGWSRGAAAALELCHKIAADPELKHIKINLFLCDPVAGPLQSNHDNRTVAENVENIFFIYPQHEMSAFFNSIIPTMPKNCKAYALVVPGGHANIVGNDNLRTNNKKKIEDFDLTTVGWICRYYAESFLREHGTKFDETKTLHVKISDIVKFYETVKLNQKGYKETENYPYIINQLAGSVHKAVLGDANWLNHPMTDGTDQLHPNYDRNYINDNHQLVTEVTQQVKELLQDLNTLIDKLPPSHSNEDINLQLEQWKKKIVDIQQTNQNNSDNKQFLLSKQKLLIQAISEELQDLYKPDDLLDHTKRFTDCDRLIEYIQTDLLQIISHACKERKAFIEHQQLSDKDQIVDETVKLIISGLAEESYPENLCLQSLYSTIAKQKHGLQPTSSFEDFLHLSNDTKNLINAIRSSTRQLFGKMNDDEFFRMINNFIDKHSLDEIKTKLYPNQPTLQNAYQQITERELTQGQSKQPETSIAILSYTKYILDEINLYAETLFGEPRNQEIFITSLKDHLLAVCKNNIELADIENNYKEIYLNTAETIISSKAQEFYPNNADQQTRFITKAEELLTKQQCDGTTETMFETAILHLAHDALNKIHGESNPTTERRTDMLTDKDESLETNLQGLEQDMEQLEQNLEAAQKEIAQQHVLNEKLKQELTTAQEETAQKQLALETAIETRELAKLEYDTEYQKIIQQLEAAKAAAEVEKKRLEQQLVVAEETAKAAQETNGVLTQQLATAQAEIEARELEFREIENTNNAAREIATNEKKKEFDAAQDIVDDLMQVRQANEALTQQLESVKAKDAALKATQAKNEKALVIALCTLAIVASAALIATGIGGFFIALLAGALTTAMIAEAAGFTVFGGITMAAASFGIHKQRQPIKSSTAGMTRTLGSGSEQKLEKSSGNNNNKPGSRSSSYGDGEKFFRKFYTPSSSGSNSPRNSEPSREKRSSCKF